MTQLPEHLRRDLAHEQKASLTPWGQWAFELPDDLLEEVMERQASALQEAMWREWSMAGVRPNKVVLAYQTVLPLLQEREAIAAFKGTRPGLEGVLPEVQSRSEAAALARKELDLTAEEARALSSILPQAPSTPMSERAASTWTALHAETG